MTRLRFLLAPVVSGFASVADSILGLVFVLLLWAEMPLITRGSMEAIEAAIRLFVLSATHLSK